MAAEVQIYGVVLKKYLFSECRKRFFFFRIPVAFMIFFYAEKVGRRRFCLDEKLVSGLLLSP
jgi:hypothetical protein